MPDIGGISGPQGPRPIGRKPATGAPSRNESQSTSSRQDSVHISSEGARRAEQAEFLNQLKQVDEIRHERIQAIRDQLDDGTYDIEGRLGGAVDGLLEDIGLGAVE